MMDVFDEPAVQQRLRYQDLIPAIADALAALSSGRVVQPVRAVLPVAPHHGFFAVMPAYAGGNGALGAKLVTFYPENVGIHTHHAVIVLFKAETGEPLAVMDGRLITEMRTAAASAVATQRLARADASVLAILGSGVQAKSHLEALRHVRSLKEVRVWSPRNAPAFAQRHGVKAAATAADAVRGADVVVVAASSTTPILQGRWLAPGTHVNAIGATRPDWRELDDDVVTTARVFVDSREAALRESGDVIAAKSEVTEIGAVVAGAAPGRRNEQEITLFKSVGVAVEDVAAAAPCTVVAIETAPTAKLERMRALGAKLVLVPYAVAWQALDDRSYPGVAGAFIHPFDDQNFITGHATMGLEILEDAPDTAAIIAAIGGGGLVTGIASAVKALRPEIKVWGAEPETAAPAALSFAKGSAQVFPDWKATFVDGAGGKSVFPRMWQRMQPVVDGCIVVSLDEVKHAMRLMAEKARVIAEGAGALGLAAALTGRAGKGPVVAIVSGGNIDLEKFSELIAAAV